jgi:hypothetical protein
LLFLAAKGFEIDDFGTDLFGIRNKFGGQGDSKGENSKVSRVYVLIFRRNTSSLKYFG